MKPGKPGPLHRDVLPAGEVDGVGGLSPNGIYWGLSSWVGQRLEGSPGTALPVPPGQWPRRAVATAVPFPSRAPRTRLRPPSQHTQQLPCSCFSLQGGFGEAGLSC